MNTIARLQLRSLTRGDFTANSVANKLHLTTMATAHKIHITPDNTGLWSIKQTNAGAKKTTELLQNDLEKHHCFFNNMGFHDHISHHLLALYGIGASADHIQMAYDDNTNYQKAQYEVHPDQVKELKDFEVAKTKLGKEEYYTDFLAFFQNEIEEKGWQAVLNEYLFKGDERSEDLLVRMFAGFLHPLIQLMYGVEWQQPAIVAMGLAQAAVHKDNLENFFTKAEEAARASSEPMPEITSLFEEVAADEKMSKSARMSDENKIYNGVFKRAWDEAIRISAKVKVKPEELHEKTVQMYNANVFEAASAALRPGKEVRFDFFLMHHVNICPILLSINAQDWIPTACKVRLLEWKIRFDLLEYAARGCPPLSLENINSYIPKEQTRDKTRADLLPRVYALHDDGHVSKLIRAIGICHDASKAHEDTDKPWLKIKGEALWTKLYQMVLDSAEGDGPKWVRGAGDPEAWEEVPDSKEGQGRL
ncbi:HypA protein [Xylaria bambusicola]|uniref:HypA protein n=1 Tax=Xylaria bambusicola TaxID=326684 RepID=UPI00200822C8|nr:HypA protein [Xylaria bambusicola]KAI0515408.1 HypA protein [Xylaria bambusicola]